jgi:large subunit ribosomal protein L1
MAKISKRMKKACDGLDLQTLYPLTQAVQLSKERAKAKFDETLEVAINLNIDTRKADQNIRGMISLPHGTGRTVRVAVFARDEKAAEAKAAGADIVGDDELVAAINRGEINFDRCIATPDMMGLVGRVAKILGPKGLMPNPKLGTVTPNVAQAVKDAKAGQIEYRAEKNGIIHAGFGKASFDAKKLEENLRFLLETILKARPSGIKGSYIEKVTVSSTMGPAFKIELSSVTA